jgi:predicted PurR-regulated permease PerM
MYAALLGLAVVVLFERLARFDEENPFLWSFLAAVAWFVPYFLSGAYLAWIATGALFAAYFLRRMTRGDRGRVVK